MNSFMDVMNEEGPHVKTVILHEDGTEEEKVLDMTPRLDTLGQILNNRVSFIGQWEDEYVVIVYGYDQSCGKQNKNILPYPYETIRVNGPIILVRMDGDAIPRDFTLDEYHYMKR